MATSSSYIVYVDESGDHGLENTDPDFPIFVLAFCVFKKEDYLSKIVPRLQGLKFKYFGHDLVVFHEREIRKNTGAFRILQNATIRSEFMGDLTLAIQDSPFTVISACIDKRKLKRSYQNPENPYNLAVEFCLERLYLFLNGVNDSGLCHVVFECRGHREDKDLELAFRRTCDNNATGKQLFFEPVFAPKTINSSGLQIADLVARPIGINILNPGQTNRAYEIIVNKFRRNPKTGSERGWGLKIFP
jgi:hypothetical protein